MICRLLVLYPDGKSVAIISLDFDTLLQLHEECKKEGIKSSLDKGTIVNGTFNIYRNI